MQSTVQSPKMLQALPIHVSGLVKKFRNGIIAVDGLNLSVEPGQIFGLLGLNGAGKTTTLRMLLGLVRPERGTILIFGNPVTPGAPVLKRVGSLVDTPGFIPHLTGLQNLELYWEAAGYGRKSPAIGEAVVLANLGDAIHREVRSYSFGMRQRLGIARALLGNPPLLILDEPTTGLDPKQVREVRSLIGKLAAQGKTILLSSHLLNEVEQVCSHAAVIHHGRIVASGSLDDLTRQSNMLYLEVSDPLAATSVLEKAVGVISIRDEGSGIVVNLAPWMQRETIPRILLKANIDMTVMMPRRKLEEAFLGMLEENEEGQQ